MPPYSIERVVSPRISLHGDIVTPYPIERVVLPRSSLHSDITNGSAHYAIMHLIERQLIVEKDVGVDSASSE